jgi:transposase, IS5 family
MWVVAAPGGVAVLATPRCIRRRTHSLSTSAANISDVTQAADLLHGDEQRVCGDSGYRGIDKRPEHQGREVEWNIAMRPGKRAVLNPRSRVARAELKKASVRAKVEHPFRYVKQVFGYAKVRYRGLHKNTQRLALLLGFTNLLIGDTYEFA